MSILVSRKGVGSKDEADARDELRFKARMTAAQFAALALRIDSRQLVVEIPACRFWTDARRGRAADEATIEKWLRNAWNTERLLRATSGLLDREQLGAALHWSFPQAYYSVFAAVLAYYHARGFTQSTHRGIIEIFGQHVAEGRYPQTISFAVSGWSKSYTYLGVDKPEGYNPIDFDPHNPETVSLQISQFLRSTHDMALTDRRHEMRRQFRTITGSPRERLRGVDWERVAGSTGWTSVLGLLYRKRIKANYGDIDTFIADEIDAPTIHADLASVVSRLNFVHEALLARAIGFAAYAPVADRFLHGGLLKTLKKRLEVIEDLCAD